MAYHGMSRLSCIINDAFDLQIRLGEDPVLKNGHTHGGTPWLNRYAYGKKRRKWVG